jgi:ligand-binding sensor domain-containing protein
MAERFETEQRLPENSVTAVVQTPDGFLWFGTADGLAQYDGARFKVLNPANTPELPNAGILNLHCDRSGAL